MKIDQLRLVEILDYIPVVSSGANLVQIFQKYFITPSMARRDVEESPYYSYVEDKSTFRSILLLVPGLGNLSILLYDIFHVLTESQVELLNKIARDPEAFKQASTRDKLDYQFVKRALQVNGDVLEYCYEKHRRDVVLIGIAVEQKPSAIFHAHKETWKDKRDIGRFVWHHPKLVDVLSNGMECYVELVKDRIAQNHKVIKNLPIPIENQRDILSLMNANPQIFQYLEEKWRGDRQIASLAIQFNPHMINNCTPELVQNKETWLQFMHRSPNIILEAKGRIKNIVQSHFDDKEVVVKALNLGISFFYASERLKKDADFVLAHVEKERSCKVYRFADPSIKTHEFNLQVLKARPSLWQELFSRDTHENRMLAHAFIHENTHFSSLRPEIYKEDEVFNLVAAILNPKLLRHIKFSKSVDFCAKVLDHNPLAFEHIPREHRDLCNDKSRILAAVKLDPKVILRVETRELFKDESFVLEAVAAQPEFYKSLPLNYQIRAWANKFLKLNPKVFKFLPPEIQSDVHIYTPLLVTHPMMIEFLPDDLRNRVEFVRPYIEKKAMVYKVIGDEAKKNVSLAISAFNQNGLALEFAPEEIKKTAECTLAAVTQNPLAIRYVPIEALNYVQLAQLAYSKNAKAAKYINPQIHERLGISDPVEPESPPPSPSRDSSFKDRVKELYALFSVPPARNDRDGGSGSSSSGQQDDGSGSSSSSGGILSALQGSSSAVSSWGSGIWNSVANGVKKKGSDIVRKATESALGYNEDPVDPRVLEEVKRDGLKWREAPEPLQKNKNYVKAAVAQNPLVFKEAIEALRNDWDVFWAAYQTYPPIIAYAGRGILLDVARMSQAAELDRTALLYAPNSVKNDPAFKQRWTEEDYREAQRRLNYWGHDWTQKSLKFPISSNSGRMAWQYAPGK